MRKRNLLILAAASLAAVFLFPVPGVSCDDGGSREFNALAYKAVAWNRITDDGIYRKIAFYGPKDRHSSMQQLWDAYEAQNVMNTFQAVITSIENGSVLVRPMEQEAEARSGACFRVYTQGLDPIGVHVGDIVSITYRGMIREIYPAEFDTVSWRKIS